MRPQRGVLRLAQHAVAGGTRSGLFEAHGTVHRRLTADFLALRASTRIGDNKTGDPRAAGFVANVTFAP